MTGSPEKAAAPRIVVTEHGPYRVSGDVAVRDTEGNLLRHRGTWYLLLLPQPWDDPEAAARGRRAASVPIPNVGPARAPSQQRLRAAGITVYDDRTVCAHFGQCTSRLPGVFRAHVEPFVDP